MILSNQQMHRFIYINIILIVILCFICCNTNSYLKEEKEFYVSDSSKVTAIILKNNTTEVKLKKINNYWKVNSYNANIEYVNYLLKILTHIQIHSKVALNDVENLKHKIDSSSVEIIVYYKKKIRNDFIVALHPTNEYCYAINKKNSQIYTLYIPGYKYSLFPVFSCSVSHWRNKTLFQISPNEINSVSLINSFNNESSFRIISFGKKNYELTQLSNNNKTAEEYIKEKVERYLSYFQQINFTNQLEQRSKLTFDSLILTEPEYKITIHTKKDSISIKTYPIYIKGETNILGDTVKIDPFCFYAITNIDSNVYYMKYTDIDPIIKKFNYFITP